MFKLTGFDRGSIQCRLLYMVLGMGYCERDMNDDLESFALECFGKELVATVRGCSNSCCADQKIIQKLVQGIIVMYPDILREKFHHESPYIDDEYFHKDITALQLACRCAKHTHIHLLLDAKADVTGACDSLLHRDFYLDTFDEFTLMMKRIIRCGGWFTEDAPSQYVLYKQQFDVVIVLLGIIKRKRSPLLLRNHITLDLIRVIAKYIL